MQLNGLINMYGNTISLSHGRFFCHFLGTASPTFESLRTTKYNFSVLLIVVCIMVNLQLYNPKSRFPRCLNCLETFTRADSAPKMADFWPSWERLVLDHKTMNIEYTLIFYNYEKTMLILFERIIVMFFTNTNLYTEIYILTKNNIVNGANNLD
jgi:hypothetical protein